MNVLVTGGAGYIGAHTCYELVDAGYQVVVLDDLSTGALWAIAPKTKFYKGNAGNKQLLSEILSTHHIESVLHFAGSTDVEESVSNPGKYFENNSYVSFRLIQSCIEHGVKNFIFSSTAAVYGVPTELPASEKALPKPISPYGTSKLATEWMLRDLTNHGKLLRYTILRYFNVAGARADGKVGQVNRSANHLIRIACQAACRKRKHVEIFGTNYPTRDGTGVRDYIHVVDLARAHIKALERLDQNRSSITLNCGYGSGYSVREVLDVMKKVSGVNFDVLESPPRPGDPPALYAKNDSIRKTLGWEPRFDDLEYICKTALNWERKISAQPF